MLYKGHAWGQSGHSAFSAPFGSLPVNFENPQFQCEILQGITRAHKNLFFKYYCVSRNLQEYLFPGMHMHEDVGGTTNETAVICHTLVAKSIKSLCKTVSPIVNCYLNLLFPIV